MQPDGPGAGVTCRTCSHLPASRAGGASTAAGWLGCSRWPARASYNHDGFQGTGFSLHVSRGENGEAAKFFSSGPRKPRASLCIVLSGLRGHTQHAPTALGEGTQNGPPRAQDFVAAFNPLQSMTPNQKPHKIATNTQSNREYPPRPLKSTENQKEQGSFMPLIWKIRFKLIFTPKSFQLPVVLKPR